MPSMGTTRRSQRAVAACPPDPVWSPGLLELAALLLLAPQAEVRRRTGEIYQARPQRSEAEVRPELARLTAMLLRATAGDFAAALGTTPAELLQFCSPLEQAVALTGEYGVKRRLDRALGGSTLATVEVYRPMRLKWSGPGTGRLFVLRGEARVNERTAGANEILLVPVGKAVHIGAGGQVLVRNPAVSNVLEVARSAGLDLDQLMAEAVLLEVSVETALGPLSLSEGSARLSQRRIRLSPAEEAVLRALSEAGGRVVSRAELAGAAHLKSEKSLEYVLVQLRDKLGDGLIATIYGAGCALEMRPGL